MVTKSESALVDRDDVAGEEGVRAHHPEEAFCRGRSGGLADHLGEIVHDSNSGNTKGATVSVVGGGKLHVLVQRVHPTSHLDVVLEDGGINIPPVRRIGGWLGDRRHEVVAPIGRIESAANSRHQIIERLGNIEITVDTNEVRGTGVEAPHVDILDTFEQEGLTHTNIVISCDGKSLHAQLFLLVVDETDEMVDMSRVDGDGLGDVKGDRAETF